MWKFWWKFLNFDTFFFTFDQILRLEIILGFNRSDHIGGWTGTDGTRVGKIIFFRKSQGNAIAKLPRKTQNLSLFTTLDRGATAYYVHHTNPNELESHNSLLLRRVSKKKLEFLNFFFAFKLGMSSSFLKSTSGHIRC